ncbi:MAG: Dihydrolipoamide succinyltransferase component (E2) of 2-oxoglutarate dehydrogenase complex [uncultured Thermomicrobiales bacterium]|uniref:Dihydrolipoyllysine-residue succinyltransferase component of 2-oxoglutarate dehydrogenase complex n=1 Tax=uncultured Thermomicrobiales bacterium TaxID=1645740 RepID=A0A6J4V9R7_9BACT|nr:MAG: Dihydrolipoamide succinyltransferase component (E2) of 2-oxoglutarate dehydrogenase complex [uncultured Thermomicrobiales bacterium]
MAVEITVPPLGESLVDAVVGQWLKGEGDEVSRGETIVELETDKVNLDVTASEDGVLARIDKHEGDVVTVGEVLGMVNAGAQASNGAGPSSGADAGTSVDAAAAPVDQAAASGTPEMTDRSEAIAPVSETPAPADAPGSLATPDSAPDVGSATQAPEPPTRTSPETRPSQPSSFDNGANRAAPLVRRLAEEHHIDLARVTGSGPGGRITREDVMALAAAPGAGASASTAPVPPATAPPIASVPAGTPAAPGPVMTDPREERVRLSRRRQTIAQRLVQAQQTAAMLTTFNEIDMTAVMEVRSRRKDAFKERHGVGLGFMSFFTKAAIGALKAFPRVNAEMRGTDELVLKHYYDIGIAVGVEEGLVVPVVRDADRKSFAEIEREIGALAVKARDNTLALSDLQGGTFTITNGGVFGSLLSTPILNAPQVGILGMHTIQKRPIAIGNEVVVRPMMYVALSYDHRIVDGREAVQFLVRIKELLEDPESLLLEG